MGSGLNWTPHCLCRTLVILLAVPLAAQKKPVTLESLDSPGARTRSMPSVVWAPDGKRFAYVEENRIWEYDAVSGKRRELITLSTLRTKAIVPLPGEANEWRNRRVAEQRIQWAPSGKDMLVL